MTDPAGEAETSDLRVNFDRRLKLESHSSVITSNAGLLAFRELDNVFGLSGAAGQVLACKIHVVDRHGPGRRFWIDRGRV